MINLIIFILIIFVAYYSINIIRGYEQKKQLKNVPAQRKSLELFLEKKHMFLLYKDYLYNNIEKIKNFDNKELREKLEIDFPNYGDGIYEDGILGDFKKCELIRRNTSIKEFQLGLSFQIISISYPNFEIFCTEIYNSHHQIGHYKGNYSSEFGNDITQRIFYIKFTNSKVFVGLSKGDGSMKEYILRHKIDINKSDMYLFFELQIINGSSTEYPYFHHIHLAKDIQIKDYHSYLNSALEKCNLLY